MWRIHAYPAIKFLVLAVVPFVAWYTAVWLRGGEWGFPFHARHGMTTEFVGLFSMLLMLGFLIAGAVLWGGRSRKSR
jgi:hypothetical protein